MREEVTPHTLRYTCIASLFAAGADQEYVADQVGHEDVTTTNRIYRYVLQRRRRGEIGRRRQLAMRESAADVERQRERYSPGSAQRALSSLRVRPIAPATRRSSTTTPWRRSRPPIRRPRHGGRQRQPFRRGCSCPSLSLPWRGPNAGLPARSAHHAYDASRRGAGCGFGGEIGAEKAGKGRRKRLALFGAPGTTRQKARFCRPFLDGETRT